MRKIYRPVFRYKKAGIMLDGLEQSNHVQGDLCTAPNDECIKALMQTMDRLNRSLGKGTLQHALLRSASPCGPEVMCCDRLRP